MCDAWHQIIDMYIQFFNKHDCARRVYLQIIQNTYWNNGTSNEILTVNSINTYFKYIFESKQNKIKRNMQK